MNTATDIAAAAAADTEQQKEWMSVLSQIETCE